MAGMGAGLSNPALRMFNALLLENKGDTPMKRIFVATVLATFALGSAAMAQDASCETKAMGKDGKPLAGAAKTSFMKKCMTETCETKAVGSDGKKLAGAAKTSFMKKCQSGA
jgi:hypothetical protein